MPSLACRPLASGSNSNNAEEIDRSNVPLGIHGGDLSRASQDAAEVNLRRGYKAWAGRWKEGRLDRMTATIE